jgi:RNA polymerase sigma-70 factor (ECF subfamily)
MRCESRSGIGAPRAETNPSAWILEIARWQDRAAFARLFQRFAPKVKAYFLRMGLAEESAEELAQETLLSVWRHAGAFDPARANASSWIFTIARNLRIDLMRRERRAARQSTWTEPSEHEIGPHGLAQVHGAVRALPREQAEVVRMAYFEDRTHVEIAESLGVPIGTVKSRIRLAAERLRASLDPLT